ncbi:MAG: zinc-dependent alcohol dehydrogenase family protein [Deltaproteobacteria bacterium]|nr:zinc-dependent alcohol dehydrogenase family protein [Deltaproteobacteria bacterium]MBW1962122.1 zinc-dependent alcohol dehydrogenase family protein [Deltaproteobacteria bacterium]MBW1994187.1 zinc-dependent alcohol dehydrogenase family protein [Deltaproteobacteria bacterium]MBW2152832.1 zinc-dependent alcohol dehydrogenase family protein [Deltaproteobacteria bacterium]
MKAVISHGAGDFRLESRARPDVGDHDVLVSVHYCGVCGTDVHMYHGSWELNRGCTPGHEVSGIVEEVGSKVTGFKPGERVGIDPGITCQVCEFCRGKQPNLCENRCSIYHYKGGGFAQYTCVPQQQAYHIPGGMPLEWAAFLEPASCCVHAVDRAQIRPGQKVAILGGGAIGLMLMQLALLSGATQVIVSEPQAKRRELARQLGASAAVDPIQVDALQAIRDLSNGGVDVVFESAGIPRTVAQCFEVLKPGGKAVLFGVNDPAVRVEFSPYLVFRKELSVLGSLLSHDAYPRTMELLGSQKLRVQPLISHVLPLSRFMEALQMHEKQEGIKILITPEKDRSL